MMMKNKDDRTVAFVGFLLIAFIMKSIFDYLKLFYETHPIWLSRGLCLLMIVAALLIFKKLPNTIFSSKGVTPRPRLKNVSQENSENISNENSFLLEYAQDRFNLVKNTESHSEWVWNKNGQASLFDSAEERRLYEIINSLLFDVKPYGYQAWHNYLLCPQVSYASLTRVSKSAEKFQFKLAGLKMTSLRADFVICDESGVPILIIEHHGGGHYGVGLEEEQIVRLNDEVKRLAVEYTKPSIDFLVTTTIQLEEKRNLTKLIQRTLGHRRSTMLYLPVTKKIKYEDYVRRTDEFLGYGLKNIGSGYWQIPPSCQEWNGIDWWIDHYKNSSQV